ncbi:MAG: glycosyltransferase [Candidatus Cloacimonetes bacterium]|nr:glycosyltransferase [Candidatus Cloacimonadota bacterium]
MLKTLYHYWLKHQYGSQLEQLRQDFRKLTFFIKTFERPEALKKALDSIDLHYGFLGKDVNILIADDSEQPSLPDKSYPFNLTYFRLDFDQGASFGRNYLLSHTKTPYFILLDDDYVFTRHTKIERFVHLIEKYPEIDILAGSVYNRGKKKVDCACRMNIDNQVLYKLKKPYKIKDDLKFYDMVVNFFIAKTDKIKELRWDDELKTVEHSAFFIKAMNHGLISPETDSVSIHHLRPKNSLYKKFRKDRVEYYAGLFKQMYQINEIVMLEKESDVPVTD